MKNGRITYSLLTVLIFIFISCSKDEPEPPDVKVASHSLRFNEVSSTGNPDWIEIYNYGEEDVDIEGFMIFDKEESKYSLPQGYTIHPGGFLILVCDDQGSGLNMPFKLTSQGERITFQRPDGNIIDHVLFPAMEDGQTYARFPDGTNNWQITGFATKNKSNGDGPVSYFKSFSYLPEIPLVGENIDFFLEIADATNVSNVQIVYTIGNEISETIDMSANSNDFSATLPGLVTDGELYYYFKLIDNSGNEVLLPGDALDDPFNMTITSGDVPTLLINEIMASNQSTILDPDTVGEYDDWIEIFNAGSTPVDMGRFYFSDSGDPFDDRISGDVPGKTTIQPGGHLLFWADSDTDQGPNHLKFKLSIDGETISLYYKDGRLIDAHKFGIQSPDISEGRSTDGADNWIKFNTPTPGASNQ